MKQWLISDVTRMKELRRQGLTRAQIATELGRSPDAIKAQLGRAGVTLPKVRKGKILIGVSGHFCAAHRDQDSGQIHGHTWQVLAKFKTPERANLVCYKAALDGLLAAWDHKMLPDDLAWGEDLARAIGSLANCVEVEVSRPAEGFYSWWFA